MTSTYPEDYPEEVTYTFNLPCSVRLASMPLNDGELRRALAAGLRAQIDSQSDGDTGVLFENIDIEGNKTETAGYMKIDGPEVTFNPAGGPYFTGDATIVEQRDIV